jgi:F-type H+-transporting ATPase subunit b
MKGDRARRFIAVLAAHVLLVVMTGTYSVLASAAEPGASGEAQMSPVRKFFSSSAYEWGMTLINFGIVCYLIYRYGKAPLLKFLDGRVQRVADTLHQSARAKEEAQEGLRGAIRKLAGVEDGKRRIIQLGAEMGEKQRETILKETQQVADHVMDQLRHDVQSAEYLARKRALELLADEVVREAEHHIIQTITPEDHVALIDRFIDQMDETFVR